jgi:hypothetical protein
VESIDVLGINSFHTPGRTVSFTGGGIRSRVTLTPGQTIVSFCLINGEHPSEDWLEAGMACMAIIIDNKEIRRSRFFFTNDFLDIGYKSAETVVKIQKKMCLKKKLHHKIISNQLAENTDKKSGIYFFISMIAY